MRGQHPHGKVGKPGGDRARQLAFDDFWEATELSRILVADASEWEARFVGSLAGTLTVGERRALPGHWVRVVWVTGDTTLTKTATADWTHGTAAANDLLPYLERLRQCTGHVEDEAEIIAIAELLNFATFAAWAAQRGDWEGALVIYTGDNMDVPCWLEPRRCGNRSEAGRSVVEWRGTLGSHAAAAAPCSSTLASLRWMAPG